MKKDILQKDNQRTGQIIPSLQIITVIFLLIFSIDIWAIDPLELSSIDGKVLKYGYTYTESFDTQTTSFSYNPVNSYMTTSTWTVAFDLKDTMEVFISTCGSEIDAYLTLIHFPGNEFIADCDDVLSGLDLEFGYTPCSNDLQAEITTVLSPGHYNLILQGSDLDGLGSNNGLINLTVITQRRNSTLKNGFTEPIDWGIINGQNTIIETNNTTNYRDVFTSTGLINLNSGFCYSAGDIVYTFQVQTPQQITINASGDSWIQLLDVNKNKINSGITEYLSEVDYSISYPQKYNTTLATGTYYLVSSKLSNCDGEATVELTNLTAQANSQITPDPVITNNTYSGKNYITTVSFTEAVTGTVTPSTDNSITTIQYFDGLGRPIQTVQRGITPSKQDLVTYTEYDGAGREWKQYLPIPSAGNGAFVDYSAFNSASGIYATDGRPFTETLYEASPLNRVLGAKKPGNAWNTHPSTMAYDGNVTTLPYFYVDNSTQKLKRGTSYATYTLYKTTVTDEDGKSATEYKDKLGQVILKCNASNVFTYYVYNDLGQLAYVLPPLAYDNLTANIAEGSTIEDTNAELLKYAYLYKYDESGNCTAKRLPGCDWIYMVYDRADRLILSQDGNQRLTNQWTVNKYDVFGRMLYTGLITESTTHNNLIADLKDEVITEIWDTDNDFNNIGYTCTRFTPTQLLTVSYYDTYDFVALTNTQLAYDDSKESEYGIRFSSAKSLLTGSRTYLLDNSGNYTASAMYYDYRGGVIQTRSTNHRGGYEISYHALNFSGSPVKVYKTHSINGTTPSVTELFAYTYDHAQRLLTTSHSLNNATAVVITSNAYDQLGRLAGKSCHNAAESTSYTYNIQNWLTSTSNSSWKEEIFYQDAPDNPMYNGNIAQTTWTYNRRPTRGYKYTYDDLNRLTQADYGEQSGLSQKQHLQDEYFSYDKMGNILSLQRKNFGSLFDDLTFEYNGNQLKKVDDANGSGTWYDLTAYTNYSTAAVSDFTYDANGNMTSDLDKNIVAIRYNVLNLPELIQFKNGNQMQNVYSASGQKLRTKYYTLYSPVLMPIGATKTDYTTSNSSLRIDDYMGNMLYEGGSSEAYHPLTKILTSEGYIDYTDRHYCYYKKDHLGSIREVGKHIGDDRVVVQKTQYYPSGTPYWECFKPGEQAYKFTGKELVTMHGLNWQDYGARWLDNVRMSWTSVDPLAELGYEMSPYSYCHNNPVLYIDPDGMWDRINGGYTTSDPQDIDRFMQYYQSEEAISKGVPKFNQMRSFVNNEINGKTSQYSDNSYFISEVSLTKKRNSDIWKLDSDSYLRAWKEIQSIQDGQGGSGNPLSGENNTHAFSLHWTDGIGPGLIALGANILPTRGKFEGATKGTSIASKYLSKVFPKKMSTRVMGTKVLGRAVGRFVPYVGWAWTFGEILYHGSQVNTRQLQNNGIDPYNYGRILNDFKCFAAGSKVTMGDMGYKNIENIVVGDFVLTYNFKAKKLEVNIVQQIEDPIHHSLLKIAFSNGENIISTDDHPYYVEGKGWCSFNPVKTQKAYGLGTEKLEVLDFCFTIKKNRLRRVQVIEIMQYDESIKTYNLSKISNSNNYFVNGILVHNESK